MIKASDIFKDKEERDEIKKIIDLFHAIILRITDEDGRVLFE